MKRILFILLLAGGFGFVPAASAQESLDHVHVGVFADYFRLAPADANMAGVGARVGIHANRYLRFEAETAYDFNGVYTENFRPTTGNLRVTRSDFRVIHGLFGPTITTGHGPIRAFFTAKGGAINFRFDPRPATPGTFFSSVDDLRAKDLNAVFYPGGGLEGHIGPVGLRLDIGDMMYFNNGAHHNLRMSFGPFLRF
jgi:hypothetical protein